MVIFSAVFDIYMIKIYVKSVSKFMNLLRVAENKKIVVLFKYFLYYSIVP